jgi:hypothetical protein
MWVAVAAVLLFTGYTSWQTAKLKDGIARTNQQAQSSIAKREELQKQFDAARREAIILTDASSVKITMKAENRSLPKLEAVWHASMGIVVLGENVPIPPKDRTLQLWLIPKTQGAKPIPSLYARPDTHGKFMLLVENPPSSMESTKALAITEEPAGGSQTPTTKPIWVGTIS